MSVVCGDDDRPRDDDGDPFITCVQLGHVRDECEAVTREREVKHSEWRVDVCKVVKLVARE